MLLSSVTAKQEGKNICYMVEKLSGKLLIQRYFTDIIHQIGDILQNICTLKGLF